MMRVFGFFILAFWIGLVGAQDKRLSQKATCPEGDPWKLAPGGRQHIVQNEPKSLRARICYCEGGKEGDSIRVVTVDSNYPGKPDPKDPKSVIKKGVVITGNTETALALGSCGDYAGQSIYLYNPNKFSTSGTYLVRPQGKDK
jgi:hypothetical protein